MMKNGTGPYSKLYALLLHLYPKHYRERYGEGMWQTFNDLLRETAESEGGVFGHALWMYLETLAEIVKLHLKTIMQQKRIIWLVLVVVGILLIPFIAMQYSDEVVWSVDDFVAMGILLFGTGLVFEMVLRKGRNLRSKFAFGLTVLTGFLLIWVNLAVGVIGEGNNPLNLLYVGVLAVAGIGALTVRFEIPKMARVLVMTAIAQMIVPTIAWILWRPIVEAGHEVGAIGVFGVNVFFATLWLISAVLFRSAATRQRVAITGPKG